VTPLPAVMGTRAGRLAPAAILGIALATGLLAGCGGSSLAQVPRQQGSPTSTRPTGPAVTTAPIATTAPTAGGRAAAAAQTKLAEIDRSLANVDGAMTAATNAQAQENR
jgi:hypothetical protein